jgi:UDP-N-acetylmuramoylalanine--D-glutamate ligase
MIDLSDLKELYHDVNYALVIGAGKSGISTCKALASIEWPVYLWDDKNVDEERFQDLEEVNNKVQIITNRSEALKILDKKGIIIPSPGIPLEHYLLVRAREMGLPIRGDVELFSQCYPNVKTIGITGTNGKSTTTALINHILNQCGITSVMGGNIGEPIMNLTITDDIEVVVLELSSFQLDLCQEYSPDISILLNISPDHLDRHGSMENYILAKEKIFFGSGLAIIGVDDTYSNAIYNKLMSHSERTCYAVSVQGELSSGVFMRQGLLHDVLEEGQKKSFDINSKWLHGEHNEQNISISYTAATLLGLDSNRIVEAILSFKGLPHRQYQLGVYDNVTFINDSKATNAEAASKALCSYSNIYWIVGGRPKQGGLKGLEPYMGNVKHAFIIGEAQEDFSVWFDKQKIPFSLEHTIEKAVDSAFNIARNDNNEAVILLSPACASFDQFCSFEERGDVFANLVKELKKRAA